MKTRSRSSGSRLTRRREALGLAASLLAERCSISRQFLHQLESGKAQPNVQVALVLARELACTVEELFQSNDADGALGFNVHLAMPQLPEGSRLLVANVGDRWVAHPADAGLSLVHGFTLADATLQWKARQATARPLVPLTELRHHLAIAGCDPALPLLASAPLLTSTPGRTFCLNAGSERALEMLAEGWIHIAGVHYNTRSGDDTLQHIRRFDRRQEWAVRIFSHWQIGWMVRPAKVRSFKSLQDLTKGNIRLINRESGSGARHWLDSELQRTGVSRQEVSGYDVELDSHAACALALLEGRGDVAIGPAALAQQFGLHFIPTDEVAFQLVFPKSYFTHPRLRAVLDLLESPHFRAQLTALQGYRNSLEVPGMPRPSDRV